MLFNIKDMKIVIFHMNSSCVIVFDMFISRQRERREAVGGGVRGALG